MGWKISNCYYAPLKASTIMRFMREKLVQPQQHWPWSYSVYGWRRGSFTGGASSPLTRRAAQPQKETANLVFLCKCICLCLIAAKSSLWGDQNTDLSNCLGCCWPLVNFKVNLVQLLTNKLNFENVIIPVSRGQSRRFLFGSCNW